MLYLIVVYGILKCRLESELHLGGWLFLPKGESQIYGGGGCHQFCGKKYGEGHKIFDDQNVDH